MKLDPSALDRHPAGGPALAEVWSALPRARLVGGVVRDLLAGRAVADIDLATPEPPETVLRRLSEAGLRAVATGLAHGTVTALPRGQPIEITTLRRDEQTDGRHAVVAWTEDWREDARRRDFTINAMSLARDGTLFDYFGGAEDLRAGRVRFVGDPAARLAEDALRILRFFRFEARYGGGAPDPAATAAIGAAAPALGRLSAERVWSELRRILVGPDLPRIVALMHRLGVLDRVLPGGASAWAISGGLAPLLEAGLPPQPVLRLALLIDGPAAPVAHALRLSNAEAERLQALRDAPPHPGLVNPRLDPGLDDHALRRLLEEQEPGLPEQRSWLAEAAAASAADIAATRDHDPATWATLRRRLAAMPRPVFPIAGRDVLACGVPPGPEVGRLLARVRDWWRDGGCVADRAACLDRLRVLQAGPSSG